MSTNSTVREYQVFYFDGGSTGVFPLCDAHRKEFVEEPTEIIDIKLNHSDRKCVECSKKKFEHSMEKKAKEEEKAEKKFARLKTKLEKKKLLKFEEDKSVWKTLIADENYKQLIPLGMVAVRLMLQDFRNGNFYNYFPALQEITNYNPVRIGNMGKVKLMVQDWVEWGFSIGILEEKPIEEDV